VLQPLCSSSAGTFAVYSHLCFHACLPDCLYVCLPVCLTVCPSHCPIFALPLCLCLLSTAFLVCSRCFFYTIGNLKSQHLPTCPTCYIFVTQSLLCHSVASTQHYLVPILGPDLLCLHQLGDQLPAAAAVLRPQSITFILIFSSHMLCLHQLDGQFAVAAVLQPQSITLSEFSAPTCCACTSLMISLLSLQFCSHRALHLSQFLAPRCCACTTFRCCCSFAATEYYIILVLAPCVLSLHQLDDPCLLLLQFCCHRALPHPDSSALRAEPPQDAHQQEPLQGRAMEASKWGQVLCRGQEEEWSRPCGHFQVGLLHGHTNFDCTHSLN